MIPTILHRSLSWAAKQDGLTVRMDMLDNLSRAAERPFRGHDEFTKAQLYSAAVDLADQMLNDMNADNGKEAVLGAVYLIMRIADSGQIPAQDTHSYGLLAATSIALESEEQPEKSGWPIISEGRKAQLVGRALNRAAIEGVPLIR